MSERNFFFIVTGDAPSMIMEVDDSVGIRLRFPFCQTIESRGSSCHYPDNSFWELI
jgi:hypothetical protein